jgi:SAM-dependent methyltransferase
MDKSENLAHWEKWAANYGSELRATTKCLSIKRLEVAALLRWVNSLEQTDGALVLEIGCGNGTNGFALVEHDPVLRYVGLDFSKTMVEHAGATIARRRTESMDQAVDRLAFGVEDARSLTAPVDLVSEGSIVGAAVATRLPAQFFDIVFTDRMLINLSSAEEQLTAMRRIAQLVRPGGLFLMLENSTKTHGTLNDIRVSLGLSRREPAAYNVFIDEVAVVEPFRDTMTLEGVEDFGGIHDLMLYAVAPAVNGGEIRYDTPEMTALTDALLALRHRGVETFGPFGQNRLWIWKR